MNSTLHIDDTEPLQTAQLTQKTKRTYANDDYGVIKAVVSGELSMSGRHKRDYNRFRLYKSQYIYEKSTDRLLKRKQHPKSGGTYYVEAVITKEKRQQLIAQVHEVGHFGRDTVLSQLSSKYEWRGIKQDIVNFVRMFKLLIVVVVVVKMYKYCCC